ncbi:MAG: hypothetical protein Greene041619_968 [Candidatus Peregrinibacteria bacterium Greene0416_19]|nr:MAG: hypothetical protein Greene041619_968 [Candidatus Peregrinibacteria bacterium Greene0416_19]
MNFETALLQMGIGLAITGCVLWLLMRWAVPLPPWGKK